MLTMLITDAYEKNHYLARKTFIIQLIARKTFHYANRERISQ